MMHGDVDSAVLKQFGARVRRRRKALGLSQETVAARAGLDRTYVGGIERGERNVALLNILRIAEALDIDPGELVTRTGTSSSHRL
jgi:transcriptional regulator with XRE-family HTH domain